MEVAPSLLSSANQLGCLSPASPWASQALLDPRSFFLQCWERWSASKPIPRDLFQQDLPLSRRRSRISLPSLPQGSHLAEDILGDKTHAGTCCAPAGGLLNPSGSPCPQTPHGGFRISSVLS